MSNFGTVLCLAFMVMVTSCGGEDVTKPVRDSGKREILFWSSREGWYPDLWAINADGTGLQRLTNDSLFDHDARWSPDGTKIVFIHEIDDDSSDVIVMNADGTNRTVLTRDHAAATPSWSPDGSQIAYQHVSVDTPNQLWIMNSDGSARHLLIDSDSLQDAWQISWTPQNTLLGGDGTGLVEFRADGTGRTRIIPLVSLWEPEPRMSPDGTKIAFSWTGAAVGGEYGVYTVNSDGTNLKRLTDMSHDVGSPVWSPDGSKIAFVGKDFSTWIMNADGTNQARVPLSSFAWGDWLCDWK